MITVTKVQLRKQLVDGSATSEDAEHLIWTNESMQILTEDGPRTGRSTAWFLEYDLWVDTLYVTCAEPSCIRIGHLTSSHDEWQQARDTRDLALVQKQAITLADLYRRGKARGLLKPGSTYGG